MPTTALSWLKMNWSLFLRLYVALLYKIAPFLSPGLISALYRSVTNWSVGVEVAEEVLVDVEVSEESPEGKSLQALIVACS